MKKKTKERLLTIAAYGLPILTFYGLVACWIFLGY